MASKRFSGGEVFAEGEDWRIMRSGHPEHEQGVYILETFEPCGGYHTQQTEFRSEAKVWANLKREYEALAADKARRVTGG